MGRRFSLFQRKGRPYYFAQLKDPATGRYTYPKSTGCDEESEALLVVAEWLRNGVPEHRTRTTITRRAPQELFNTDRIVNAIREAERITENDTRRIVSALTDRGAIASATLSGERPESEKLLDFLKRFWDYDNSEYVREKISYGHSIGRRHCYENTRRLHHWEAYFAGTRLADISRDDLRDFSLSLREKGLAPKTCNMILAAGTVALSWAKDQGIIETNPAEGLRKFSGKAVERGILSPEEAQQVFTVTWSDKRARVGNLVAMTCGLRSGEVLALRREDIGEDRLHVRHSWSFTDGLKTPKNGEEREAPLLPAVRDELLRLSQENPHGPNGFIFHHHAPDRPCDGEVLRKGLMRALVDMSLPESKRGDEEKRKKALEKYRARGVAFHSWRHFYSTHLADKVELRAVQLATGHKTGAMAEHYAKHKQAKHWESASDAVKEAFGNVLPFEKKTG